MPNCLSAAKRLRQTEKRRVRNKARKTELKTIRKKYLRSVHDGDKGDAEALLRRFMKRVDQATASGFIHKNTASRDKARLAKHLTKA
ncbi:MAG: 30S ribosomal protein S20 [Planctomycetota bacterium]|jgi:small subunit ribosomal protein S20|nr:30S ribosomal protein S20 [Planctomycetota bacterium]